MAKKICKDTLFIKNLPPDLTDAEKKDLLSHFGATSVKILTSKYQQKSNAYAKFDSEETAKNVLFRLHQMNILGSRLCVEYAKEEINFEILRNTSLSDVQDDSKYFNMFLNKLNSWNVAVSFHQPAPPHLKYLYPKPNRATINNIAHALASVPKFYTQVLHLMNKMNLPPPFSNIPDPPESNVQPQPVTTQPPKTNNSVPNTSSESELESDPEEQKIKDIIPQKRTKPQKKIVKKPKFIKPTQTVSSGKTNQNTADVFEVVDLQNQKKIEVRMSDTLTPANANDEEEIGSFGLIPSRKIETADNQVSDNKEKNISSESKVISDEELTSNRISPKDFGVLSVFKNYHAGAPSCRIYIKNLSKNVEIKDLEYIYKRYELPHDDKQGNMFDVRLMQEGRMKGQAFVTLQDVVQAQKAVKETNGYILKNKPLVVVFARSAVPKSK